MGHRLARLAPCVAIAMFTVAVSAVGFWKYTHYRYGGLDLAIYTNVLYGLSHGSGWYSSIQGGSYLGDHVEPILLAIAPLFRIWPDPRFLIILQALALGFTTVPISLLLSFLLCQRRESVVQGVMHSEHAVSEHVGERAGDAEGGSPTARNGMSTVRAPLAEEASGRRSGRTRERWCFQHAIPVRRSTVTLLPLLWLLNPLLWNAALFEFHALAFAPLFLLSAAYCYVRRRFWWFLFWILLALSVREDIALIVIMFSVVAAVDRWRGVFKNISPHPLGKWMGSDLSRPERRERGWAWIVAPIVLGAAWFFLATRIAAAHSPSSAYKFLVYYGWLGDSFTSVIGNAFAHPLRILQHLASIGNIDMALGLFLPFLFLPLLRPRWLLLAASPLLQIILSEPGGSSVVIDLHYSLLFLPALVLAMIDALQKFSSPPDGRPPARKLRLGEGSEMGWEQSRWLRWVVGRFPLPRRCAMGLGIATYLVAAWMLGPFPGIAGVLAHGAAPDDRARRAAYDQLLAHVPSDAPIVAGYAALPHVAARSGAYALAYTYLGMNQYAFAPYVLPDDVRHLLLDRRDAVAHAVQFPHVRWSAPHAAGGPERLHALIAQRGFRVVEERDGVALLARQNVDPTDFGGLDPAYISPSEPVRGRLVIDSLRDIIVQLDG